MFEIRGDPSMDAKEVGSFGDTMNNTTVIASGLWR
jgi:hypothetical protein